MLRPSEQDVVDLLVLGLSNSEIAERLNIKRGTVKCHLFKIYKKLNVKSDRELIANYYNPTRKETENE